MSDGSIAVCRVLGAGFLAHDSFTVNPDAVATAGAAWEVHQRAPVALVAEPPLGDLLSQIAARAVPEARGFVQSACPPGPPRRALADTAPRDGLVWLPPDRIDSGAGPAVDYARTLADLSGLADPRPVAPWRQPFDLWLITPAPDDDALLDHLFAAPTSSWVRLGDALVLATDHSPPGDARPLGRVPLGALYLTAAGTEPALAQSAATALIATSEDAPPPEATRWTEARFSRWP